VSLYGPNGKPSWFLKLNPRGTVPVLLNEDSGEVYPDSDLILDYLNLDKSESSLKEIESWRNVLNARLIPIGKRAVLNGSKKSLHELKEVLLDMELLLKIKYEMSEGSYVKTDDKPCTVWLSGGKEPNVADCSVFPFIWRLQEEYYSMIGYSLVPIHNHLKRRSNHHGGGGGDHLCLLLKFFYFLVAPVPSKLPSASFPLESPPTILSIAILVRLSSIVITYPVLLSCTNK
jgi:hypothetical protein